MRFLMGILGAVIASMIAWAVNRMLNVENEWLTYVIAGVVAFIGFSIAQAIYDKVKKKGD